MAELTNTFTQGKMNKDLDERLVPNGQYRDALNLEVSSSEGSNIGALQTVLGNSLVDSTAQASIPSDARCIGSAVDEENDNIYWFLASSSFDTILELSGSSVTPVIVDTQSILNFGLSNLITGVNILDGVLYFTDDLNEPRQVDISYWKAKTQNSFTHTPGLAADRISLYKKAPLNAPTYKTLAQSFRGGNGTHGGAKITTSGNIEGTDIGSSFSVGVSSFLIKNTTTVALPAFEVNDLVLFNRSYITEAGESNHVSLVGKLLSTGSSWSFEMISKQGNIDPGVARYNIVLKEDAPLFELEFPRFAYRYKYNNNQFSTISPFSSVAFIPEEYSYDSKEGFNLGMTNNVRKIELEGWKSTPVIDSYESDIKEIEIIYKKSESNVIYVADTLKASTATGRVESITVNAGDYASTGVYGVTGGTGTGLKLRTLHSSTSPFPLVSAVIEEAGSGYSVGDVLTINFSNTNSTVTVGSVSEGLFFPSSAEIKENQVLKTISSDQILRPYDAIPQKAKAMEVTGNRLVFGNYVQNFDIVGSPQFTPSVLGRTDVSQKLSVKTDRSYQFGVVYQDEYGRRTPVFTDSSGVINLDSDKSTGNSRFRVKTTHSNIPSDITHFKYYIKETSSGYYNLPISTVYQDKQEGYIYVAIPTSEINKVEDNDTLVLKKQSGNVFYNSGDNKFRVVSKLSNPPDFLAYRKEATYKTDYLTFASYFGANGNNDPQFNVSTTKKRGSTPVPGHSTILISEAGTLAVDSSPTRVDSGFLQNITVGSSIRFSKRLANSGTSDIYVVKSIQIPDVHGTDKMVEITFETEFGDDVNVIYDSAASDATLEDAVIEKIERVPDAGNPEYDGKFFLKLNNSTQLKSALFGTEDEENLRTIATDNHIRFREDNSLTVQRQYFINEIAPAGNSLPEITTLEGTTLSTAIPSGFHIIITNTEEWDETIPSGRYKDDIFNLNLKEGNYIRLSAADKVVGSAESLALSQETPPITLAAGTVCVGGDAKDQSNYKIMKVVTGFYTNQSELKKFWALKLPEAITPPWDSNMQNLLSYSNSFETFTMDVRAFPYNTSFTPFNPALFEIETKDSGLDIYYETEKTYPITELSYS